MGNVNFREIAEPMVSSVRLTDVYGQLSETIAAGK